MQQTHKEVPIPNGFSTFVSKAYLRYLILQEIEDKLGENEEVLCSHLAPFALLIHGENHVERPMELVLELPLVMYGVERTAVEYAE